MRERCRTSAIRGSESKRSLVARCATCGPALVHPGSVFTDRSSMSHVSRPSIQTTNVLLRPEPVFDELVDVVNEDSDGHQCRHQIDPKRGGPPIDAPRIPPVMPTTVSATTASPMTTPGSPSHTDSCQSVPAGRDRPAVPPGHRDSRPYEPRVDTRELGRSIADAAATAGRRIAVGDVGIDVVGRGERQYVCHHKS